MSQYEGISGVISNDWLPRSWAARNRVLSPEVDARMIDVRHMNPPPAPMPSTRFPHESRRRRAATRLTCGPDWGVQSDSSDDESECHYRWWRRFASENKTCAASSPRIFPSVLHSDEARLTTDSDSEEDNVPAVVARKTQEFDGSGNFFACCVRR
mmetsp:Transcript_119221/g.187046  ORF Transcript_119221/g.187046 Transcript_119221/m.187046 type:complete len:155 (+) Transcript_119221:103-567(+)